MLLGSRRGAGLRREGQGRGKARSSLPVPALGARGPPAGGGGGGGRSLGQSPMHEVITLMETELLWGAGADGDPCVGLSRSVFHGELEKSRSSQALPLRSPVSQVLVRFSDFFSCFFTYSVL